MDDLRKAAEMALEALETLWDILDDIDTTSDIAKENDAWYRKRVEFLQKKRWDTSITTDGYKLKGGVIEALRQALAQPEQESVKCMYPYCETASGCDGPCSKPLTTPVDAVNMTQERVDETEKRKHEPVAWYHAEDYKTHFTTTPSQDLISIGYWTPLYTAPPKREWVGLTDEEFEQAVDGLEDLRDCWIQIEAKLKEKNRYD